VKSRRQLFVELCSELTGYSCVELEGTGLVEAYQQLLEDVVGTTVATEIHDHAEVILASEVADRPGKLHQLLLQPSRYASVMSSLLYLWYLGTWNRLPDSWYHETCLRFPGSDSLGNTHVPSALAYVEQLSYRTALAHPPGAKPTGWGSWSREPV
jgi:hypothetical protein